jgi:hypothetical protein
VLLYKYFLRLRTRLIETASSDVFIIIHRKETSEYLQKLQILRYFTRLV